MPRPRAQSCNRRVGVGSFCRSWPVCPSSPELRPPESPLSCYPPRTSCFGTWVQRALHHVCVCLYLAGNWAETGYLTRAERAGGEASDLGTGPQAAWLLSQKAWKLARPAPVAAGPGERACVAWVPAHLGTQVPGHGWVCWYCT